MRFSVLFILFCGFIYLYKSIKIFLTPPEPANPKDPFPDFIRAVLKESSFDSSLKNSLLQYCSFIETYPETSLKNIFYQYENSLKSLYDLYQKSKNLPDIETQEIKTLQENYELLLKTLHQDLTQERQKILNTSISKIKEEDAIMRELQKIIF